MFQEELNNATLREALDLLPLGREDDLFREVLYKLRIACFHNCTIKLHPINVGIFVLHRIKVVA